MLTAEVSLIAPRSEPDVQGPYSSRNPHDNPTSIQILTAEVSLIAPRSEPDAQGPQFIAKPARQPDFNTNPDRGACQLIAPAIRT